MRLKSGILEVVELTRNNNCTSPLTHCSNEQPFYHHPLSPHYVTSQANKPAKRLVQFIHSIFWSGLQFTCYRYFYPGYYALYNQPSFFRRPIITNVILMELPGTRLTFSMAFTFYIILHFTF